MSINKGQRFILLLCLFLFVGCSTEFNDPEKVVRAYYKYVHADNNFGKAYKYLSSASQKHASADEFAKVFATGKNRKVEQLSVLPDDKEKPTYRRVKVIFETTDETDMSYKDIKYYTLINEDGKWKIVWLGNILKFVEEQYDKGLYDEAIKRAEDILTIDPYNAWAYDNIAWSSMQMNNVKQFIASAKKAIALEPDVPGHYNIMANYYGSKELWSLAIDNLQKAISMGYGSNTDQSTLYSNMAFDLSNQKSDEKALTAISKAIELDSSSASAYYTKGYLLLEVGKNKEAVDACLKAIDINEKNKAKLPQNLLFGLYFHLSKAEFAMNDYSSAKKHISMALDIKPDDSRAQNLYYQLK